MVWELSLAEVGRRVGGAGAGTDDGIEVTTGITVGDGIWGGGVSRFGNDILPGDGIASVSAGERLRKFPLTKWMGMEIVSSTETCTDYRPPKGEKMLLEVSRLKISNSRQRSDSAMVEATRGQKTEMTLVC